MLPDEIHCETHLAPTWHWVCWRLCGVKLQVTGCWCRLLLAALHRCWHRFAVTLVRVWLAPHQHLRRPTLPGALGHRRWAH